MVRIRRVLFVTLLPLGLAAQQAQQIPWTTIGIPAGTPLTINVPGNSFGHWIVGVNVSAGSPEQMKLVDAVFRNFWPSNPAPKTAPYFPMTPHPLNNISISGSTVSLGGSGQTLIVYVSLAQSRAVTIACGSNSPVSATVDSGLVVADGVVKGSASASEAHVIGQGMAAFLASVSATPKPTRSRSGVTEVTDPKYLRSHLTRYVELPARTGTGQLGLARLQVSIGTDGRVQGVSCPANLSATGFACEDIKAVVMQWAFDPFFVNGQRAPVVAPVMLIATQAGVISTLSPGWAAGQ